jgi:hypothetical protein
MGAPNQIRRLVPYLQAATGNVSEIAQKIRQRVQLNVEKNDWISEADLDILEGLKNEMMEELIELDGVLAKAEKLVRPKES